MIIHSGLFRCSGVFARAPDGVRDLQPLELLLLPVLARLGGHLGPQPVRQAVQTAAIGVHVLHRAGRLVQLPEQRTDGLGADLRLEGRVLLLAGLHPQVVVLVLVQQLLELHVLLPGVRHHVAGVVDHLLQVAQRHAQQVAQLARQRLEEPDVDDGHGQLDVAHPLAPHLAQRHLHTALVADVAAEADALELPAVALPVLHGPEDPLTEQPVPLRLERPVVDGLRLGHLTVRPPPDLLRRRELDLDEVEVTRPRIL
jgi:hypothetical protein